MLFNATVCWVVIEVSHNQGVIAFLAVFGNEGGAHYTLPFEAFADRSRARYWRYRAMEATGLSTF